MNRTPNLNELALELVSGPEGLSFDPATGDLARTPTEAQGPDELRIVLRVTDDSPNAVSTTTSFQVTVAEVNSASEVLVPAQPV